MNKVTLYVGKKWFEYLQTHCIGHSGLGGTVIGMRRSMWGNDAYVVSCNKHVFRVSEEVFNYVGSSLSSKS